MKRRRTRVAFLLSLSILLLAGFASMASAQGRGPRGPEKGGPWPPDGRPQGPEGPANPGGGPPPGDIRLRSFEPFADNKVVKGAPYSATVVTETVQTLTDGSKLTRKKTDTVYRDGEGRTRREQQFDRVGPFPVDGEPHQVVFISDPVSGQYTVLDPNRKTANRSARPGWQGQGPPRGRGPANPPPPPGGGAFGRGPQFAGERNTESLGKQTIEGLEAVGTRTTVTIPAGRIGNERPLETISERWESTDLQIVLLSKHIDPFAGETTYRVTNLKREEPAKSLFDIPGDYTLQENRPGNRPDRAPWDNRPRRPDQ